jgi:putative hydrolase of the HAD superfamily
MNISHIDTIIFDLGQVIIDLTPDRVISSLQKHTDKDPNEIVNLIATSPALIDYETGQTTDEEFCSAANKLLNTNIDQVEFEDIWISFLGEMKIEKLELLQKLKENFKVLILSNTNEIHQREFDRRIGELYAGKVMADMVHTAHYSQDLKLRKPDRTIFERVIEIHNLIPDKTLFFDDREDNIEAARRLGIDAVQINYSNQILDQLA